jgi:hypothetical protein
MITVKSEGTAMKRTGLVFCVAVLLVFAPTYVAAQSGEEIYREWQSS